MGSLWFTLIGFWFPDPASRLYGEPFAGMALDLASVLVAFPVFLLVMRHIWRELLIQPAQADSAIRRWLTYLALLAAASTVIGDVVAFVAQLLRGSITAPFVLKVAVVLVLAGGVFWYFLGSVQFRGENRKERLRRYGRVGSAAAAGLVVLTLALSFAKFGSPAAQRLSASDERRSEDLEAIARVIQSRWTAARGQETPALPQSDSRSCRKARRCGSPIPSRVSRTAMSRWAARATNCAPASRQTLHVSPFRCGDACSGSIPPETTASPWMRQPAFRRQVHAK